jgi:hypothetical protein
MIIPCKKYDRILGVVTVPDWMLSNPVELMTHQVQGCAQDSHGLGGATGTEFFGHCRHASARVLLIKWHYR